MAHPSTSPAVAPELEREWTDRAALARKVAESRSREEAIRMSQERLAQPQIGRAA